MSAADRDAVFARAAGSCERCGRAITAATGHAHHRKLRSRGGGDGWDNLTALCPPCHAWAHRDVAAATRDGWIVPSWIDPATYPVVRPASRIAYLPRPDRWVRLYLTTTTTKETDR